MPYVTIDGTTAFRAETLHPERWNGFVNPYFDRDAAEAVADWLDAQMYRANHVSPPCRWEGDVLIVTDHTVDPEDADERFEPGIDGLYGIGCFGWTWSEVTT